MNMMQKLITKLIARLAKSGPKDKEKKTNRENMKTITIEIPDGKKAEWKNGVLTLVDEKDNRPVTERIKTFEDALKELGDKHPLVLQYKECFDNYLDGAKNEDVADIVAYLKLRIIAAALNEGWTPQFTVGERRWFPWFVLYTQDEINRMDKEQRGRVVYRSGSFAASAGGVAYAAAPHDSSATYSYIGSRLAFKTENVARYAGKQFLDIWADYVFRPESKQ